MSCLQLYLSHVLLSFFFHGSTVLVGLGLLTVKALSSHSGVDYTGIIYSPVTSEFSSRF